MHGSQSILANAACVVIEGDNKSIPVTSSASQQLQEAIGILQRVCGSLSSPLTQEKVHRSREDELARELHETKLVNAELQRSLGNLQAELEPRKKLLPYLPEGDPGRDDYIVHMSREVAWLRAELAAVGGGTSEPRPRPVRWDAERLQLDHPSAFELGGHTPEDEEESILKQLPKRPRTSIGSVSLLDAAAHQLVPAVPTMDHGWWHGAGGPTAENPLLEEDTPIPSAQAEVLPMEDDEEVVENVVVPRQLFQDGEVEALEAERAAEQIAGLPAAEDLRWQPQQGQPASEEAAVRPVRGLRIFVQPKQHAADADNAPNGDVPPPPPPWRPIQAGSTAELPARSVRAQGRAAIEAWGPAAGGGPMAREVVRNRTDRQMLPAFDCAECRKFYGATGMCPGGCFHQKAANGAQAWKARQGASRHRLAHAPCETPPGFWDLSFPDDGNENSLAVA